MPLYHIPINPAELVDTLKKTKSRVASPIFIDPNREVHISRLNTMIEVAEDLMRVREKIILDEENRFSRGEN